MHLGLHSSLLCSWAACWYSGAAGMQGCIAHPPCIRLENAPGRPERHTSSTRLANGTRHAVIFVRENDSALAAVIQIKIRD